MVTNIRRITGYRISGVHVGFLLGAVIALGSFAACSSTQLYVSRESSSWTEQSPPSLDELAYRIFLIGDAGREQATSPTLRLLKQKLDETDEDGAVVFLGDNVYNYGLPDSGSADRAEAEEYLLAQLDAVKHFPGRIVFIPGNHDWNNSQPGGREAVARQEDFVEAYLGRGNTFLPDDGFPGPIEVELTDRITLLAFDTQWWFSDDRAFGDTGEYQLREPADVLFETEHLLTKHRNNDVLVVAHHPLMTNGDHGGRFPLSANFSPFPIVGTLRILYRQFVGNPQDLSHRRYKLLRRELENLFARWDGDHLIYAGGHDHSLQYFEKRDRRKVEHHIVSGSGSSSDYVAGRRGVTFSAAERGFASLQYYSDNSIWIEFWAVDRDDQDGRLLFRQRLREPILIASEDEPTLEAENAGSGPDYRDSTMVVAAGPGYKSKGLLQKLFLGSHHRDLWAAKVNVPFLDVLRDEGGLTPVKEGGRSQTVTMRFRNPDGRYFMLRSIDKVAGRIWPLELQQTFAHDLVQDQFAMLNPYGAFLVPHLASAAGVYHTNPRLVYVPDDLQFGGVRANLAGSLALFEERPDGDMSDLASMGNASNVISTVKMLSEINDDNDHRVDAHSWARTRLFDMLIADWDRSQPNFRWAAYEPYELDPSLRGDERKEGKIYQPVPRDRDIAFTRINGLFPTIYKTFFERAWQDFRPTYGHIKGLNKKGVSEDRRFAASLSRQDWVQIARSIVDGITDDVISTAVRNWPDPIIALDGARTINILKTRRDKLPEIASKYYDLITRVVDVVGSNKHERFEITRLNDDETEVVVYKTSKEGEIRKQLFRRMYHRDETEEIRLFGLDGNDQFLISGSVQKGILIRAIGGPGTDTFVDKGNVEMGRYPTRLYDNVSGNSWDVGLKTRVKRSQDPANNSYDPNDFQFNKREPLLFFGSNKDDGLFLGGGTAFTFHGFRKTPYAFRHRIVANFSSNISAFNVKYSGHYVRMMGNWDILFNTDILFPNNIRNFYGLGNETSSEQKDSEFYQARLKQVSLAPSLYKTLSEGFTITLGPRVEYTAVQEDTTRFIAQPQSGVSNDTFKDQVFGGLEAILSLSSLDDTVNPMQGFSWTATADFGVGLRSSTDNYARLSSSLALFLSPSFSPQITLAARVGGAHNFGDFPFFKANALGGKSNLRGYRSTRFAGRSAFFTNVDLRMKLFDFAGYLAFGNVGILGFLDNGRVWADGEDSDVWHTGYGGGVWTEIFRSMVVAGTAGFSEDDKTFTLGFGFQF